MSPHPMVGHLTPDVLKKIPTAGPHSLATAHSLTDQELIGMLNRYTPELPHLQRTQIASPTPPHSPMGHRRTPSTSSQVRALVPAPLTPARLQCIVS